MSPTQRVGKRVFDMLFSLVVLITTLPLILTAIVVATIDTHQFGLFAQQRVGRYGRLFRVYKVRTMRRVAGHATTVTMADDVRITSIGRFLRKTKLDELPQFFNVLIGKMSVVGPRPDMPGYADELVGKERTLLKLRPGITGAASVYFRDEESLLMCQEDPERFNDEVLWPCKVKINLDYFNHYSFFEDLKLIMDTALPFLRLSSASQARIKAESSRRGLYSVLQET